MTWQTKIPKFRRFVIQNFPFIEQDFDALTDYGLLSKIVEFLNKVITSQNSIIEEVTSFENEVNTEINTFETNITNDFNRLEGLFNDLKSFVDHYFDNLDVQEEINNKLDEMVEAGTLQEIITTYIQSNVTWTFDTVADMKHATNLVNGSYARTLGYYTINDGGGACYKIIDTGTANEMDIIEITGSSDATLLAELVINNETNIKNFGAMDNRGNDINPYWSRMLSRVGHIKIPDGRFLIHNPITITSAYNIDVEGSLFYDGSDYAFIVTNCQTAVIKIKRFDSDNGGLFNISPTNAVSFVDFDVKISYCKKETFYMNANNGIVTMLKLRGIRWSSNGSAPIIMYQDTNTIANSFLSQIDIFDVDLLASLNNKLTPAIIATCDHTTKSINFNLTNVDMENSTGITTYKRVFSIGIYNCRMGEINYKQGWLTFNDYMPLVTLIGNGDIDPYYFTFNNLPDYGKAKSLVTNMNLIDHVTNSTHAGGGIVTSRYMKPFLPFHSWKSLNNDIDNNAVTLPAPTVYGNLYNYFTFSNDNDLTITVPDTFRDDFWLSTSSNINITVVRGNKSCTIPSSDVTSGDIHISNIVGNALRYNIIK